VLFSDDQYPVWPLTPALQVYASIDGARMKSQVVSFPDRLTVKGRLLRVRSGHAKVEVQ
jgi:hypothetical protein